MRRSYKRLGANVQRFDILGYPYTVRNDAKLPSLAKKITVKKTTKTVAEAYSIYIDNIEVFLCVFWPKMGEYAGSQGPAELGRTMHLTGRERYVFTAKL